MKDTSTAKQLWLNSSVAYILAGPLVLLVHECSHLVAGLLLGEKGILYGHAVDWGEHVSTNHQIITAATGPLFSMISGFILIYLTQKWGKGFWRLFWLWFGFLSAMEGVGYLFITPFGGVGDTGRVMALLDAPYIFSILAGLVGVAGMFLLAKLFATQAVKYTTTTKELRSVGLFAWLTGTIVMVIIGLPGMFALPAELQFAVLMGTISLGIFTPLLTIFYQKVKTQKERLALSTPYVGVALAVIVNLLIIFVVEKGIHIG